MGRSQIRFLVIGLLFTVIAAIASADDAKDKAIKKDRKETTAVSFQQGD